MHARAHLVAILSIALLAAGPLLLSEAGPEPRPEEGGQSGVAQKDGPPSIAYGGSRASSTWITKPDGSRVAVGKGVEWQGVTVYLSLLWDLVGVDTKSGKTLYAVNVGAFWNALGFKEVQAADGSKAWAVELRPGPGARQGQDRRQYHDLGTGKKLTPPGLVKAPPGKRFTPRKVWSGGHSRIEKSFHVVITTAENWSAVRKRMFGASPKVTFGAIDFDKEVVLVVSSGNVWNCRGIAVAEAYESDKRVLIRTERHTFQTMGGGQQARPYGVIVLPRRAEKAYVVERNRQGLIGGPALWTESWRLEKLGKPADELKALPASSDTRHDQWIK